MKYVLTSKILRKTIILSCLIFGLAFIAFSDNTPNVAAVYLCCSDCGGRFQGDTAYCEDRCGSTTDGCYDNCLNEINYCWRNCRPGCHYGGGQCDGDYDCGPVEYCNGGTCAPR